MRDPRNHDWLRDLPDELAAPAYNVAPGRSVPVVGLDREGERVAAPAYWGFRPKWYSGDRKAPINARAETAGRKPMFRSAFARGRCLVPADGWYEWQARTQGPKQPWFFHAPDDRLFWFAGLAATDAAGERTMALLTREAGPVSKPIHGRMPVVIRDDAIAEQWLQTPSPDSLLDHITGTTDEWLDCYPVSRAVNRPATDGPELLERIDPEGESLR